jgi:outer membrane protein assembly factor BamB
MARDRLWVGAWRTDRLAAIDPDTNRRLRRLQPPGGGGTADLVVTHDRLWVASRDRRVLALDPRRGLRRGRPVPLATTPSAIVARGDDVWVGLEFGDGPAQMSRIDGRTGDVATSVPVAPHIQGIVYAGGRVWTLHGEPNHLVARDPATLRLLRYVALPGTTAGALASGAGALWATLPDEDQLVRYELRTGQRATVSVGGRPIGVAVHRNDVWVAASGSSTIERVAAASLRPVGDPIRVPLNPLAIAVTDEAIWVTCVGENVVARVAPPT